MKIKWLGHATFLVTSESSVKVVIDPYASAEGLRYGEINETADVVTVSHDHFDHNNVGAVKGNPRVIRSTTDFKGIKFRAIPAYHDEEAGKKRGAVTVFCIDVDGLTLCHLGDLGQTLTPKQIAEIGKVDILMVPVGGYYTIDARAATAVCEQLKPKVIIPMHFKTDSVSLPIVAADDFLKGKKNIVRPDASEVEFKLGNLPAETQIIVLKPAR